MLLLSVFTGWLLSASYAPIGRWYLAPIAIALWMWILHKGHRVIMQTFLIAFSFNAFFLQWSSIYVGNIPWLILSLGQALLFLPLAWARKERIVFFPPLFLILEHLRSIFPFEGFAWGRLAFSQADSAYRGVTALGGVSLLTAFVLCFGLILFFATRNWRISATYLTVLAIISFGSLITPTIDSVGKLRTLLVQGNVPSLGIDFNSRAKAVFAMHLKETQRALKSDQKFSVIIWPENSVDVDPYKNLDIRQALDELNRDSGKSIIIGAVVSTGGTIKNASILWNKDAESTYIKQHLTPFGEYIPLRNFARYFSPYVDDVQDFTAGEQDVMHKVDNVVLAPVICYELIDDAYINRISRNSQILIVQTNNATFGTSAQSIQQLSISRIRAIENHRDLLSVSTTGISAVINSDGKIIQSTKSNQPDHLFADSNLYSAQTLANKLGNWSFLITLAALLILGFHSRRLYD